MARKTTKAAANHLRAWREYRGLTQAQLAEAIGTADNVISLLESGDRSLSPKWLNKLAPALRTRAGFLLEFDPQDADLAVLEAITDLDQDQKPQAVRIIRALRTGTTS